MHIKKIGNSSSILFTWTMVPIMSEIAKIFWKYILKFVIEIFYSIQVTDKTLLTFQYPNCFSNIEDDMTLVFFISRTHSHTHTLNIKSYYIILFCIKYDSFIFMRIVIKRDAFPIKFNN